MERRRFLFSAAAGVALAGGRGLGAQPKWPTQPVKLIVPYPAGGGTDFFARVVAPGMGESLGQSVIVENRPGASGMIAGSLVSQQQPADGYTVLLGDMTTYAVNPTLFGRQQQYDVQRDLKPVTMTARFDFVLVVNPAVLPVTRISELIAAAAKAPDGLNYASPSLGTTHHLAMEMLAKQTGMKMVAIQYKGGGPAVQDLLGGQVALMFLDRASARPHIESGKLRPIAAAGSKRIALFPEVPTVAEQGVPGFDVEGWQGFTVRSGTPDEVVAALGKSYAHAIQAPEVKKKLSDAGIDPVASSPEQFARFVEQETARWRSIMQERGIKGQA